MKNQITLEATVARMKAEVLRDIAVGTVPRTVESFSELHDYVDANYYGGFCEDAVADALIAQFGGRDEHEGLPSGMTEFMNAAQTAIDTWLCDTYDGEVTYDGKVNGAQPRSLVNIDNYYYVQKYNPAGDNWIDRIGTRSLEVCLQHKQWEQEDGATVRCVVVVRYVIV